MPKLVQLNPKKHAIEIYPSLRGAVKELFAKDPKFHFYQFQQYLENCKMSGPAYTMIDDEGNIIGTGGISVIHPGVGRCWFSATKHVNKHKLYFYKTMKRLIHPLMNRYQLHRIEGEVAIDKPNWLEWPLRYGFKKEGIAKSFGPDKVDYVRIAYIKGDN